MVTLLKVTLLSNYLLELLEFLQVNLSLLNLLNLPYLTTTTLNTYIHTHTRQTPTHTTSPYFTCSIPTNKYQPPKILHTTPKPAPAVQPNLGKQLASPTDLSLHMPGLPSTTVYTLPHRLPTHPAYQIKVLGLAISLRPATLRQTKTDRVA